MSAGIVLGLLLGLSLAVFVVGLLVRLRQWWTTPQPWPVPTTPAPATAGGVVLRLLRETFLFESLWRASRWTWVLGWSFHLALLLAFLGHLRFATEPLWPPLPDTGALATGVGVLMLLALAGLWVRRLVVDRVRRVTLPSDHLWLALLVATALSGMTMGHEHGLVLREWVWGLLVFEARPLPASAAAVLHVVLVTLLLVVFPFGKLLHGPALWFNPTRNQADRGRRPAARQGESA